MSSPLSNYIPIDESKDDLKSLNDFEDTFDIMFKEFDKLISKLAEPPPLAQISPDFA